uniref:Uncharacterized protein n=1 Tax=Panagrolaimus sp. ES5 TaxID=591445 RepID=A0AC34G0Q7_9BILA
MAPSCSCPGEDQNIDLPAIMESLIAAIIYAIAGFLITRMWLMLEPKANQLFEIILVRSYLRLRTVSTLSTFSDTVEEVVGSSNNRKQTISKSVFIDFGKDFHTLSQPSDRR